ncbi:recombinase family protein [Clostridium sp. WB02_MRS01]|uniref:recombinase family protein n=1 Tax=Clostridium sp. WB02_MRS01 TaxID=2605777 RepID=UPI0012B1E348|nr:recombinase family protein [Clostridium sp. WB02_MRS01]MSS11736.1 recombinase family protein [Clostridium sp. WB02_MRS01]
MDIYGYARVSTKDQNLARQLKDFEEMGIERRFVIVDEQSGKDFNRRGYNTLVGTELTAPLLHEGDLLVIHSIDRMGRNYTEIQEQWKYITHTLKANIKVLDMPLLDTSISKDSLDNRFIADLTLQILAYVAEKERLNIKTRQKEGIASMPVIDGKRISSKTGKASGRPATEFPKEWEKYYTEWKSENITAKKCMDDLNLKRTTFYKLVKMWEERGETLLYKKKEE